MEMERAFPPISEMTLPQKIGQILCVGWGGDACDTVNEHARFLVNNLQAGAIVVMGRNVRGRGAVVDTGRLRETVATLQNLSAVPLLVATDQEGGRVARLQGAPFTDIPAARGVGASGDVDAARDVATATARELASVGINWNFAPVADVDSNPQNPVIGDRAFARDAETVAQFVMAQIAGYGAGGVLACAKHFPGHGDTLLDSHFDLPTLPHDLATMRARELVPFHAAIEADVPTIMTAHILFPALDDSGLPATMSRAILQTLLRDQMGFSGLLVTDCLEMRAVADTWGTANAALAAIRAGADMVMVCHTRERQQETFDTLLAAAQSGDIPAARIEEAVGRVLAAKARAFAFSTLPLDFDQHRQLAERIQPIHPEDSGHGVTTLGESAPG